MALTPLLQSIQNVLRPGIASAGAIELAESDPGSTISPFRLKTTQPTLVLRFDRLARDGISANDRLFPLLDPTQPGLCVCCDYVLLWQRSGEVDAPLYVLLAELKSGAARGAMRQIENTRLVVDHLLAMVRHHGRVGLSPESVRYRGLVFTPAARPPGGDPRRVPCPYQAASPAMRDLLFAWHPPCAGYHVDWFCTP